MNKKKTIEMPVEDAKLLPKNRNYTPIEASFQLELDRYNNTQRSIRRYAKTWGWSRTRVINFLEKRATQKATKEPPKTNKINKLQSGKSHKRATQKATPKKKYIDCIYLTQEEYNKLTEQFGVAGTAKRIRELNDGIMSHGYKYQSHYHTILAWDRRRKAKQPQAAPKLPHVNQVVKHDPVAIEETKRRLAKLTKGFKSL